MVPPLCVSLPSSLSFFLLLTDFPPCLVSRSQTVPQSTLTVTSTPSSSGSGSTLDASSSIFVTTTDSAGHTITSAPSVITSIATSTDATGGVYTYTQYVRNSGSGSLNDGAASGGSGSGFFANTGAVVGVFVVVGIAGAAMLLAAMFFVLRRRRRARLGAFFLSFPLSLFPSLT